MRNTERNRERNMEIETQRQRQRYTKGKIRAAERTLIATNICGIHGMGKT